MARYWVVSPNIGSRKKNSAALQFWKITVIKNRSAYLGWGANSQMGRRFAEIAPNDVILIAHGSMENHGANRRLVACGRVRENLTHRDTSVDDSAFKHRHRRYATLDNFVPLDEDPALNGLCLRDSLHDGDPRPRAVFELKPNDRHHTGNQRVCDWLDRTLNQGPPVGAVLGNSVRIDADANSEPYEIVTKRQVIEAKRLEQQLVNEFVAALANRNIRAERLRYTCETILYCDVYIPDRGHLIEAKGSVSRGDIRMAIGQLFDYRLLTRQADKRIERLALLLPNRPPADVEALLTELEIGVIWRHGQIFSDNCEDEFVR